MKEKISVVILCGGESRRMGEDKANLIYKGETFTKRIIRRLFEQVKDAKIVVDEILLSLRDESQSGQFEETEHVRIVFDHYKGCGPLAGMEAAFEKCRNEYVFVTSCDMPFVDAALINELFERWVEMNETDAIIPIGQDGRIHGLCGLYKKDVDFFVKECLECRNYKVRLLLDRLNTVPIKISDLTEGEKKFRNINTKEDYRKYVECRNVHGIPIVSIVAFSGTGKTTFLVKLIPELKRRGLRVAVVKHDAHDFEIDREGKDSFKITQAGADVTGLISDKKAVIMENRKVEVWKMLDRIEDVDVILTEGFKHGYWPKIMLHREETKKPFPTEPKECLAVVSNAYVEGARKLFSFDDVSEVAEYLVEYCGL